jgi:hypothetical protein
MAAIQQTAVAPALLAGMQIVEGLISFHLPARLLLACSILGEGALSRG